MTDINGNELSTDNRSCNPDLIRGYHAMVLQVHALNIAAGRVRM